MPQELTEAQIEGRIDRAVQRRLSTDSAYVNAENAEAQAEREAEITAEEEARYAESDSFLPVGGGEYGGGSM